MAEIGNFVKATLENDLEGELTFDPFDRICE
jgi:hypothetical protein